MKMPKTKRMYCPKCQHHTDHKVTLYKKGRERKMAQGNRRYRRKKRGYGSQPKPIQHNQCKVNKKISPMYTCSKCDHMITGTGIRLKSIEIMRK